MAYQATAASGDTLIDVASALQRAVTDNAFSLTVRNRTLTVVRADGATFTATASATAGTGGTARLLSATTVSLTGEARVGETWRLTLDGTTELSHTVLYGQGLAEVATALGLAADAQAAYRASARGWVITIDRPDGAAVADALLLPLRCPSSRALPCHDQTRIASLKAAQRSPGEKFKLLS